MIIEILVAGWCVSDPEYDPHTPLVLVDYFKRYAIKLERISVSYYMHKPGWWHGQQLWVVKMKKSRKADSSDGTGFIKKVHTVHV